MNKEIPLTEASLDELRTFATGTLGLQLPKTANSKTAIAKIKQAHNKDHIIVSVPDEPAPEQTGAAPQPATAEQQPPPRKMVRINIPIQDKAGGKEPVSVSVNGKAMRIERNKDSVIPVEYLEALQHAVRHEYMTDEDGNIDPTPIEVPNYPFNVIGSPFDEVDEAA